MPMHHADENGVTMAAREHRLYMISIVSEMLGIHPQTLRLYEREGFIKPRRSGGNTRLYSEEDVEKLEMILRLTRELGVNLAGVEVILSMREKMEQMQREMEESIYQLRSELTREMRRREEMRTALVPVRRVKVTKLD
jgi:MerR family transcriptional regulator/heat shock protein HspR